MTHHKTIWQKDASVSNGEMAQKPRGAEIEQRNPFLRGLGKWMKNNEKKNETSILPMLYLWHMYCYIVGISREWPYETKENRWSSPERAW